jgi:hypothetical protein
MKHKDYDVLQWEYINNHHKLDEALQVVTYLREQVDFYEQKIQCYLRKQRQLSDLIHETEVGKADLPKIEKRYFDEDQIVE